jgi:preprotein translocase subunit SecD
MLGIHFTIFQRRRRTENFFSLRCILHRRVIITGDQIVDASSGLDQNGSASVNITLNGIGAKKMGKFTKDNIGQPMAVVFIEQKTTQVLDQQWHVVYHARYPLCDIPASPSYREFL